MGLILAATGVLMVIAVVLDLVMGWFEGPDAQIQGRVQKDVDPRGGHCGGLCLLLPYGRGGTGDILLYDGDYSETQLMHHMVKMLVEDQTDLTVTIQDQMSQVNNWNALKGDGHTCDLMISYDGTILTTFLHQDTVDVPEGMTIYEYVKVSWRAMACGSWSKLGFENTYAIGVPEETGAGVRPGDHQRPDPRGGSADLRRGAGVLYPGGQHEVRALCGLLWPELQGPLSVDMGLKYSAIENGSFDVAVVYTTDGLNTKVGLKILEDDKSFFPDYNGVFLVREICWRSIPELEGILNQLAGRISTDQMAEI
ncbi:MAG: glycine betaine ABC transporter substrate-binding protein [Oscillospiraceae bacterium]